MVREVAAQLPQESVLYFGDTARVPYGGRTMPEIIRYGREIGGFLTDQGVKLILVACNTSSALALDTLIHELPVPLLGVIDAAAAVAVRTTACGRIGVLATVATANSGAYEKAIAKLRPEAEVFVQSCPALVPLIEAGRLEGEEVRTAVASYLKPLLEKGIDTLVYGCTHYPFLDRIVADLAGSGVARVDPASALVARAVDLMRAHDGMAVAKTRLDRYIVSGSPEHFRALGSLFLQHTLPPVEQINLEGYRVSGGFIPRQ